jgi:hypothetical protein
MTFEELKPYTPIQFQTNNEWNGFYGTIDSIYENLGIAYVFSPRFPCYMYKIIKGYNEGDLKKVDF